MNDTLTTLDDTFIIHQWLTPSPLSASSRAPTPIKIHIRCQQSCQRSGIRRPLTSALGAQANQCNFVTL